ncbi:MAG TPA: D-alanyl-D-alanine carboxypeptidase [Ilumatobacteraceae bacterium]|nr:D-alanyl-D-alanine carboxypeptidase [Ilumatobacteraceae bacterium]
MLVAVMLVPAFGLMVVHRWSADAADAAAATPPIATDIVTATPAPALTTQLVGFRRIPATVSRSVNAEAFAVESRAFLGTLNDRSCGAIAVDGHEIAARNEQLPVIPASTQKLLVAAVALEQLGEEFTYTTTVRATTPPTDGIVDGDLHLVGGGDPLLSSDWYPESNLERFPVTSPTSLDTLADRVVAAGVSTVTGRVVGDGSRYDDEFYAPGWGVGVPGLEGGPYDALMVNDSRVLGEELRASDPNSAAAREFSRLLSERGVAIAGDPAAGPTPPTAVDIAAIESAPMSEVVAEMLGNSDNNTAELVVKELGVADSGVGTREAGLAVMRDQLVEWEVDVEQLVLADGSGLSLDNRLTCAALAAVVGRYDSDSAIGRGLPVAGQTGTLTDAFVDHSVAGRLLGKTGTLNNPPFNVDPPAVKALAGFLPVEGGGAVEYVLVLNGPTISDQSEYRPIWTQLADTLDTYPSGPGPALLGPR